MLELLTDEIESISSGWIQDYFFVKSIVNYIAGYVAKRVRHFLKCFDCAEVLIADPKFQVLDDSNFIFFVSKGNLTFPSSDVLRLCLASERYIQANVDLTKPFKVNINVMLNKIIFSTCGESFFRSLDSHVLTCDAMNNHPLLLMKAVVAQYLEIRLKFATKLLNIDQSQKVKGGRNAPACVNN